MKLNHPVSSSKRITLLGWFVLLSGLAHGLFLAIPEDTPDNKLLVSLGSPLQVTVISSRTALSSNQATVAGNRPATNQQTSQQKPVTETKTVPLSVKTTGKPGTGNKKSTKSLKPDKNVIPKNNPVKTPVYKHSDTELFTEDKTKSTTTVKAKNVPLNHLRQQLKETIRARFTYPRMAQRMGWEGLVGLSLHIEDDGSLNQVRIARSSGHKILDENARKTIQHIGRLQVASNLTIRPVDTEIEVLYRLTE